MAAHLPELRLYAILDAESCARRGFDLFQTAAAFAAGGVCLLQYRDKLAGEAAFLQTPRALRKLLPPSVLFLLNDYPGLVQASGADGVHVGQTDQTIVDARDAVGPERIVGVSTHSADQALVAGGTDADYVAIGPVFATGTKPDAAPAWASAACRPQGPSATSPWLPSAVSAPARQTLSLRRALTASR